MSWHYPQDFEVARPLLARADDVIK